MTVSRHALGSDLRKVDEHQLGPDDYADAPELSDAWFESATLHEAGLPVRRGRPPGGRRKQLVTLRIDPDVIERFKAGGPGWQTRMTDILKQASVSIVAAPKA